MSRILQALKQLEARPATEQVPAVAPPPAPSAGSGSSRLPTMPFVPPSAGSADRRPTERVNPHRQKRKAVRTAEKQARALQTAAEIEQLLHELQPSVTECWNDHARVESVQVSGYDPLRLSEVAIIASHDRLPEVVTIREPAAPRVEFATSEIECWSPPQDQSWQSLASHVSLQFAKSAGVGSVLVHDQLPLVITIQDETQSELTLPASPVACAPVPVIELPLFAPSVVEQSQLPHDWLPNAVTEIDFCWPHAMHAAVVVTEHLPQVVTIREPALPTLAPPVADVAEELIALQTLAELREMLRGVAPSVMETWIPLPDQSALVIEEASGVSTNSDCASSVVTSDYAPLVITIQKPITAELVLPIQQAVEEIPSASAPTSPRGWSDDELAALLGTPQVSVMESWISVTNEDALVIEQTADYADERSINAAVIASDYAPKIITIREPVVAEEVLPARMVTEPMRRDRSEPVTHPNLSRDEIAMLLGTPQVSLVDAWDASEINGKNSATSLVNVVDEWSISDVVPSLLVENYSPGSETTGSVTEGTEPEVELHFRREAPRRRTLPAAQSISKSRRQRHLPRIPDERELAMRKLVRGPRGLNTTPLSAWESTLRDDLLRGTQAGEYRQIVERWRADQRAHNASTLLVTSLGEAFAAADVVMHAALLLAEASDSAVLVIEADDEGAISRRLGLTAKQGLGELLSPHDAHGETIFPTATPRLHVLPRGRSLGMMDDPASSLRSLLVDLAHEYGWILIAGGRCDAPMTTPLARVAGATYVVAPMVNIDPTSASRAVATLRNAGARMLGSIIIDR